MTRDTAPEPQTRSFLQADTVGVAALLVVVLSAVWFSAVTLWVKRTDADERVPSVD